MHPGEAFLSVARVRKQYATVLAVDDISLSVARGEIVALLGPNGAGKTTLLRMLVRITRPDSGVILWDGADAPVAALDLGYLPEDRGLYQDIPIKRTLSYFARLRGMGGADASKRADEWLERLGLLDRANEKLGALSKGNQQKVQFAAAVLHRPRMAILDEPFSGLDPVNQEAFLDIVRELRDAGSTILLSAHQMSLVERVADRVFVMHRGRELLHARTTDLASGGSLHDVYVERVRAADGVGLGTGGDRVTRLQQTLEVARWEFNRFVKWRQQFIGLAVMAVLGVGGSLISRAIKNSNSKPATVAVVGADRLGFALPTTTLVNWDSTRAWSASDVRAALASSALDGALIVASSTQASLLVRKRSAWTEPLAAALNAARQEAAIERLVLTPQQRTAMRAPLAITTDLLTEGDAAVHKATRATVAVILGFGLMVLFSGFGTMFIGITSEKTQRVTEQIIAMVPPQAWMDGKMLGLAGAAIAGTMVLAVGFLLFGVLLLPLIGFNAWSLPPIVSDYGTIALILLTTLLGVAMWFAVMAAIAATIDDPNSSTRSLLLFLPMLPSALAFVLVSKADTGIAQAFAMFPLTAMSVLPMRLMLTTVPWWEVVLAIAGLLLAVWFFRIVAGRIFAAAILMHGKEPGARELWRWMRAAG